MEEAIEWLKDHWRYVGAGILACFAAGIMWLVFGRGAPQSSVAESVTSSYDSYSGQSSTVNSSAVSTTSSIPKSGYVYVSGAVKHPGLYHVTRATRWADVVQAAGGLTGDADAAQVNLAQVAHDQENLNVPVKGEQTTTPTAAGGTAPQSGTTAGATSGSAAGDLIDLNTATVTDLQTISGIGPKRAQDIIDYRTAQGGFKSVDDLKEVSGIGDKIFADIQPHVTVGP